MATRIFYYGDSVRPSVRRIGGLSRNGRAM